MLLLQVYPPVSSCSCDLQSCEGEAEGDVLVEAGTHCSRAACHSPEAAPRSLHPHLQWQEGESIGQPDITYGKSIWSRGYESVDSLQVNHCSTASNRKVGGAWEQDNLIVFCLFLYPQSVSVTPRVSSDVNDSLDERTQSLINKRFVVVDDVIDKRV